MTKTSAEQFDQWLMKPEDYHLEFKEAKNDFSRKDLHDYCAALANEGGGKLILGVRNKDRVVVGTKAYLGTHNTLAHDLYQVYKIRIDVEEFKHPLGRVLIFHVPCHRRSEPVHSVGKYKYPMRIGESLTEMDMDTFRKIARENEEDPSARPVSGLTVDDLDDNSIRNFLARWAAKARRNEYLRFSKEKAMLAAGLMSENRLNLAALVLFGKKRVLDELLATNEIIFEWRQDSSKTPHDDRVNWRGPFFGIYNEIWASINARNLRIPFQEGLFQREVFAFNEKAVREALNNAVAHRDYLIQGRSIFIKASPQEFCIESPGGFPPGVTPENILKKSDWRNRRIAEIFEKAGLVERAGQGMDDIFDHTIREGKGMPNFKGSDPYSVVLHIPAQVKDKDFILYLERVIKERQISLPFEEIYELEKIRENQKVKRPEFKKKFLQYDIIEPVGKGRGTRYILSRRYYDTIGQSGKHTRIKGLSRDQIKDLILNHLRQGKPSRRSDLISGFSECSPKDISNILQELKRAGKIIHKGTKIKGSWIIK